MDGVTVAVVNCFVHLQAASSEKSKVCVVLSLTKQCAGNQFVVLATAGRVCCLQGQVETSQDHEEPGWS